MFARAVTLQKLSSQQGTPKSTRVFLERDRSSRRWWVRWESKNKSREEAGLPLDECDLHVGISPQLQSQAAAAVAAAAAAAKDKSTSKRSSSKSSALINASRRSFF